MDIIVIALLGALAVLSLLVMLREGLLKKTWHIIAAAAFLCLAFSLRAIFLPTATGDYNDFLSKWVETLRTGGGFPALSESIGNYNFPYLYILAIISYFDISSLYLIKLVSIAFDILLAFACMKLVGVFSKSVASRTVAFIGTLLLPTVIMNGALWAQCDSIYVSLGLLALWFALSNRPVPAMIFAAISFSFKLQAVFILPVFAVFLFTKRMKIRHLFVFPLSYLAMCLPALIAGRPFMDTITLYLDQAESVGLGLNYNSPSIFSIIHSDELTGMLSQLGVAAALLFTCGILLIMFLRRSEVRNNAILSAALLFVVGIPFFLPHMHDRYFFFADVLSFAFCVAAPRFFPVAALCSFASILGYHAYLKLQYLLPMHFGAYGLIIALIIVFISFWKRLDMKEPALE